MFVVPRTTPGVGSHGILIAGHQMVQEKIAQSYAAIRCAAHPGLARHHRPHAYPGHACAGAHHGHRRRRRRGAHGFVARRVLRGYRPHEGYWPTEYIPAKRDNARRRMRPVLDARPDLGRTAEKYAARRSAVAWMGIAVLRWADA